MGGVVSRAVTSLTVIERIVHLMESPILSQAIACCLLAGERKFHSLDHKCEVEVGSDEDKCEKVTMDGQATLQPTTPFPTYKTASTMAPLLDGTFSLEFANESFLQGRSNACIPRTRKSCSQNTVLPFCVVCQETVSRSEQLQFAFWCVLSFALFLNTF